MQDLKHALRLFGKSPAFTAVVLITLALGIGANTAVFSILYETLLRPLPYKDPSQLVSILDTSSREKQLAKIFASYSDYEEFARDSRALESVAAETWAARPQAVLTGHGLAKAYLAIPVTADFFKVLGVSAAVGRTFTTGDLRGGCAVVLSDEFWRGPLGGEADVVGRTLTLDDQPCVVKGVMPASFAVYPPETQMWTLILPSDPRLKQFFGVFMIARLRRGVSIGQARSELIALHSSLHAHDSNEHGFAPLITGLQDQFTWLAGRNLRSTIALVFAAVMAVLAIACVNVANLLLGRSRGRAREFSVRIALGSGTRRLFRQLLVESALLTGSGGVLGVGVAFAGTRYFAHVRPVELPVGAHVSTNVPALLFAAVLSIATAVIFAMAPAWMITRRDVHSGLRAMGAPSAPSRQLLSRMLVGLEMALSVLLLVAAGLLMRSVLGFESAPLGFARENILTCNVSLPHDYEENSLRRVAFYDKLERKLAATAGPGGVAIASTLPPYGLGLNTVEVERKPVPRDKQVHDVGDAAVSNGYFDLLQIPLRRGRFFGDQDSARSVPVAVVNEAFAREYFGNGDPIGQKIRMGDERNWLTVVGISGDEKRVNVYEEMKWLAQAAIYRPLAQHAPTQFSIAIRRTAPQSGIAHTLELDVSTADSRAAIGEVKSMESRLAPYVNYPRFRGTVLTAFSLLATLLAAIGVYGVLAHLVAQRTAEIGVRMAVGATARDVALWVARVGGAPVLAGLAAGFLFSLATTRYLASLFYGITSTDPSTFAAVAVISIAAAGMAMIVPAKRAASVDPIIALRSE